MKKYPRLISCFTFFIAFLLSWNVFIKGGAVNSYTLEDFPFQDNSKQKIILGQNKIDVLHYELKLDLFPESKLLSGSPIIQFKLNDTAMDSIHFNFYNNMKITKLELNQEKIDYQYSNNLISFANMAKQDTFILEIDYEGTPQKSGLGGFIFGKLNGKSVVYNLSEPDFASTWFPCNDLPTDKAMLDIYITNDSSQVSVSNGNLINISFSGNRKTYHWKTIYPISTYLVSVYSSNYVSFSDKYISMDSSDTMSVNYFVFPSHLVAAGKDFKNHPKMLNVFSMLFGEYPFIKEKYGVAEFLWQAGAMEHQTITGIGSNFVSGNNFFEDIYIHELAHQWWGNAVGLKSWKDIWLNEGFATYSEALYYEALSGSDALKSTMLSKYQDRFKGKLYDPGENLFGTTVYDKGAWVLHMLRWEVGDEIFFKILKEYFNKYKYLNASTEDFKIVCESLSTKNLETFFAQWVYKGVDQIKVNYHWNSVSVNDSDYVTLNIEQVQNDWDVFDFKLQIHVIYLDESAEDKILYVNQRDQQFTFKVKEKPEKIILDYDNWLLGSFENTADAYE